MKYYKMLNDSVFVGAITSGNFVAENPRTHWLFTSNENLGQYVSYEGQLYRDYWMQPIPKSNRTFINVTITEITQEEYNIFIAAIENNETIVVEEEVEEPEVIVVEAEADAAIEYVRASKIHEMSTACRTIIENGFDLELRGAQHHFSLDTQDQLNLISLSAMAQTQSMIPYHADGEMCIFYTAEEINEIVSTATAFKVYHTTYYNALKGYINALNTIEEISAITYGTQIPEEYQSDVLKALSV